MQDIKYHLTNTVAVILFSYTLATTVNQFFRFNMNPVESVSIKKTGKSSPDIKEASFEDYSDVILGENKIFVIAEEVNDSSSPESSDEPAPSGNLKDLKLLGTISGPSSIARALIKKKKEKNPEVFKLWSEVYGYKLVRIDSSKVYLKTEEQVEILDMYAKDEKGKSKKTSKPSASTSKDSKNISRSELQQKVFNNMDNALKGLRAGPYRVGGKIEGYKLFRVRPSNILYTFGARSGDIVKRVNGHPVNSTEKLMQLWGSLKEDKKISVDIERGGKIKTFDFNITD